MNTHGRRHGCGPCRCSRENRDRDFCRSLGYEGIRITERHHNRPPLCGSGRNSPTARWKAKCKEKHQTRGRSLPVCPYSASDKCEIRCGERGNNFDRFNDCDTRSASKIVLKVLSVLFQQLARVKSLLLVQMTTMTPFHRHTHLGAQKFSRTTLWEEDVNTSSAEALLSLL